MKSKAKPVRGSARVKKFDVGGTVGALAGLGTLAYLLSRKKKAADGEYKPQGKFPMEQAHETATESKAAREKTEGEKRAMAAAMGRPEMGDVTPEMESDKASRATPAPKTKTTTVAKRSAPAAKTTTKTPATSASTYKTSPVIEAGKKVPQSKPTPKMGKPNEERPSKPYPAKQAEANKAAAERRKGQGLTPMAEYKGMGSKSHIDMIKDARRQIQAEKEKEEKARKSSDAKPKFDNKMKEYKFRNGTLDLDTAERNVNFGMRKGGKVKKYAEGGMTSSKPAPKKPLPPELQREKENQDKDRRVRKEQETYEKGEKTRIRDQGSMFKRGGMTASKRADGIAQRGKTRGKVY